MGSCVSKSRQGVSAVRHEAQVVPEGVVPEVHLIHEQRKGTGGESAEEEEAPAEVRDDEAMKRLLRSVRQDPSCI